MNKNFSRKDQSDYNRFIRENFHQIRNKETNLKKLLTLLFDSFSEF